MEDSQVASGDAPATARRPRVLVVDDDAAIRLICVTNLELDGCEVIEARDGQEGFELALLSAPDLALVDLSMPVLDGFGLAAALRNDDRTRQLPFVVLTGETGLDVQVRAYEAGALGYFTKPFDPAVVRAFVQAALSSGGGAPPRSRPLGGHSF